MLIVFLVEEPSAEAALRNLVPKIVPGVDIQFAVFQGKQDLLSKLPGLLKGYRKWLPENWRIVVLVDEDRQDCLELKAEMEKAAAYDSRMFFMTMSRSCRALMPWRSRRSL